MSARYATARIQAPNTGSGRIPSSPYLAGRFGIEQANFCRAAGRIIRLFKRRWAVLPSLRVAPVAWRDGKVQQCTFDNSNVRILWYYSINFLMRRYFQAHIEVAMSLLQEIHTEKSTETGGTV